MKLPELGCERGAHFLVQRGVFDRRDLAEPVGTAPAVAAGEQTVEEMVRRRVHDDVREVLAADEVDVVDAEIGRHDLVAGRAVRALPLDQDRRPAAQAVARVEEGAPVHQRRREDVGVLAFLPRPQQELVVGGRHVEERFGFRAQRGLDVVEPEHSQPGDDLGDRRPEIGHYVCPPAAYLRSFS